MRSQRFSQARFVPASSGVVGRAVALLLLLWVGVACNSGGGNGGGAGALTGRFVDGPVAGLRYSTPTLTGETNAAGEFRYQAGETVSFLVGDILVGQAPGAPTLSPFDLAGGTPPQTGADIRREVNRGYSVQQATPLEVAANIAVFLQTLDEDGDPSNGITIPAALDGLAAGVSLDFQQNILAFPRDFSFRKLLAAGRAAGLWGGSRAIRNASAALDALYAGLGLTPSIEAVAVQDDDSAPLGSVNFRQTFTYDANGNRTQSEVDSAPLGSVDSRLTSTYDANGNRTQYEVDNAPLGSVEYRQTSTYDANGNRTQSEVDNAPLGSVDSRQTWTYDANGNQTQYEVDNAPLGSVDFRQTLTSTPVNRWAIVLND